MASIWPESISGLFVIFAGIVLLVLFRFTVTLIGFLIAAVVAIVVLWLLLGVVMRIHRQITGG